MATSIRVIVALGNPGAEHADDRHNAGFWLADALAQTWRLAFRSERRYKCELLRHEHAGATLWLQKPLTYMNNSGAAVQPLCAFYKIEPQAVLVVHDDLDLPAGVARLKQGGGHGGHNGLRDIHRVLGPDYCRLRIGIGHPGHRAGVLGHVLSSPAPQEREHISTAIDAGIAAIDTMITQGWDRAVQQLHSRRRASATGSD
ncbi:MAG TPA: aminoacyl-tRNA hydrolase [Salinisphaeraceae bacterium]|nr:aminoacyl-tRNA hydrolase [Salinisphaeraceae bacterium]